MVVFRTRGRVSLEAMSNFFEARLRSTNVYGLVSRMHI